MKEKDLSYDYSNTKRMLKIYQEEEDKKLEENIKKILQDINKKEGVGK